MAAERHTTRRAVLKAAPALAIAPVAAVADVDSEIMRLFHECVAFKNEIDGPDSPYRGAEVDEAALRLCAMEERMCAIPATTVQELAAKVCVWTDYCEDAFAKLSYSLDPLVLADVRKLSGFVG